MQLAQLEVDCIREFNSHADLGHGYNMTAGGEGAAGGELHHMYGRTHSVETIERIKATKMQKYPEGFRHTDEAKRKIAEAGRGRRHPQDLVNAIIAKRIANGYTHSQETREKIGEKFRGKKLTPEHIAKRSASQKGKPKSAAWHEAQRKARERRKTLREQKEQHETASH